MTRSSLVCQSGHDVKVTTVTHFAICIILPNLDILYAASLDKTCDADLNFASQFIEHIFNLLEVQNSFQVHYMYILCCLKFFYDVLVNSL